MSRFLEYAKRLNSVPTAPYRELWLRDELDAILKEIPGVVTKRDRFGNTFATVRKGPRRPAAAFVAHLDHPGFLVDRIEDDGRTVHATFEGHVENEFFKSVPVRLFRAAKDRGIVAEVLEIGARSEDLARNRKAVLRAKAKATGAVLGMWDLKPFRRDGELLRARVVDDLIGVAMIVEALRRAAEADEPTHLRGVFTRAEEAGFRGTLCICTAADSRKWLPQESLVVSVETSSQRPGIAPVGGGGIIRIGDRSSIFDPAASAAMVAASDRFAREHKRRKLRRALMDGGSCEGTAFNLFGWRTGAVCVPLGNYHNMNHETKKLEPEFVAIQDCEDLVAQMQWLGTNGATPGAEGAAMKTQFEAMAKDAAHRLLRK